MYIIEALPAPVNAHELELLINAEPATIGHFITHGIPHPEIKAHLQNVRAVGTAVTVRMPGNDGGILHYAMGCARPGDFWSWTVAASASPPRWVGPWPTPPSRPG